MSYTRKSASRDAQAQEAPATRVISPKFNDQRASTQVQLKQQDLMQAKATTQRAGVEEEEPMQAKLIAQRAGVEEEEPLQGKFTTQLAGVEEEEPLQGKFEPLQRASLEEEEPAQTKPNNTGLPDNLKTGIENLSGYALDDVKVHYNSDKPATLNAHAYAQGTDIHVAPGQEQHLPHEAWHVVQQKQGRVQPTTQMQGQGVNDDAGLEHEADVMGAKALSTKEVTVNISSGTVQQFVIQRAITIGTDAKAPGLIATQIADYMGDFSYALACVRAVDGQTFASLDELKAAISAPLTANQLYVGGTVVTVKGIGGRCNEHMTHAEVVTELRTNKSSISIANDSDQRIQILEGKTGSWKDGYVCLKYSGGELQYWHAHHGFPVG